MYVNQIDDIIDKILNKLYLEALIKDKTFRTIVDGKKLNYVEFREQINNFIKKFMEMIDIEEIKKVINNKENLNRIYDIIKRYVAYYYFLSIAFYYTGSIKDFRNNLIQYSKLQENSTFHIKNFFDTQNNYTIINFFKIIKDVTKILTMTELQKKTLNALDVKGAIDFLNSLGKDYIDQYLLSLVKKNDENFVEVNVHNLIKTIVFREIYRNQEQGMVFELLNDIEESKHETIYIDIVVSKDYASDYESFRQIFLGDDQMETLSVDLFELVNDFSKIQSIPNPESKNNSLLSFDIITPIVDDFLRYHRDTERLSVDTDKSLSMPIVSSNNAKNIQLALLYQQRKKKENTKAQVIINKIEAISDYYSDNVKNNPEILKDIKKYFQNPLSYRKAVLHNYLDEVHVVDKILNQDKRARENNEYFLELEQVIGSAYFNFKDFEKYGTSVNLDNEFPINMLRYNNIETKNQMTHLELDMHTAIADSTVNIVGLAVGPFNKIPMQCTQKENLVDIRTIKLTYMRNGKKITKGDANGYNMIMKIIKYYYVDTINVSFVPKFKLYRDYDNINKLNPSLVNKVIYWIYDINTDEFEKDTYENFQSYNFQDIIRFMNSIIYDRLIVLLRKRLVQLIKNNIRMPIAKIEALVEVYSILYNLYLTQEEKKELIIRQYLQQRIIRGTSTTDNIEEILDTDKIEMPEFIPIVTEPTYRISIDIRNPLHPKKYVSLEQHSETAAADRIVLTVLNKCIHENEWNNLIKMKRENLNKYNTVITKFIETYAMETAELDFVCKVCGQILPLKQYVQDGSFNNNTQKFVTAYVPLDIPLEDIKEYKKYSLSIKYLDSLINRVSLMSGTNMLVGTNSQIRQKRKGLVKNIIDIILKHNYVNLQKNINDEERLEYFHKNFNIAKDFDNVYFFELDDSIFNFSPKSASANEISINQWKYNNVLLYFILIFITELNGAQITMMSSDKFANIYVYIKYGPKLFGDLLIKKNINGMDTIPIVHYPVLCYLIYIISYYLVKHGLWRITGSQTKAFNLVHVKIIINSIVDLFNSISIDAGNNLQDYAYILTTTKLYSQLNSTFKNNDIINILKNNHINYSDQKASQNPIRPPIKTISLENPIEFYGKPRKIPNFKISSGIQVDLKENILYKSQPTITDMTNCPYGSYHHWAMISGRELECVFCGEKIDAVNGTIDRSVEAYYYNLNILASQKCLEGTTHNFVGSNGVFKCSICGRKMNEVLTLSDFTLLNRKDLVAKFKIQEQEAYEKKDLDILATNLEKVENENVKIQIDKREARINNFSKKQVRVKELKAELIDSFHKEFSEKNFGQYTLIVDKFIAQLELHLGQNAKFDVEKYPIYLKDNIYIINHSYDGTPFSEPIIFIQKDNRIFFKEDHIFFKTDVYYYVDGKTQTDVFYHAVTLKLLGYKEKHKDYVRTNRVNEYLIISYSIRNRILLFGYDSKYMDINEIFNLNKKFIKDDNENYYDILNSLIREHIFKIKLIVGKFISFIYKIKNYQSTTEPDPTLNFLQSAKSMDAIITKFDALVKKINLGENNNIFDEWNVLRNSFNYEAINWPETNIRATENKYINSETVNYYDFPSTLSMYFLINKLIYILNDNTDKNTKISICQMYVEIILYVYNLYNLDNYKNSIELKRFEYILNASDVMVDMLRKGHGLVQVKQLEEHLNDDRPDISEITDLTEEQQDEIEDLKEEAEALDIEHNYYEEENEDYAGEASD